MEYSNLDLLIGIALFALLPGFIAKAKGRSFWGYYFLGILFSPLVSLIVIIFLKSLTPNVQNNSVTYSTYSPVTVIQPKENSEIYARATPSEIQNAPIHKRSDIFYCRACGAQILRDSVFCAYCGFKLNSTPIDPPSPQCNIKALPTTPTPKSSPLPLPETGKIFCGKELPRDSLLTIHSEPPTSCFVKLKNRSREDVFSFFVRAGDSVNMAVPAGLFYVHFAQGTEWYGASKCFGDDTVYFIDDELLDFYDYSPEYTLHPPTDGNYNRTFISENEF